MIDELKPCPFCNEKADIYNNFSLGLLGCVGCNVCDVYMIEQTKALAIKKWNRRYESISQ